MSAARKSETCEEQLRRMCKNIAEEITKGTREVPDGESPASEYMEHVYDIRYIVDREKRYYSAELLVAGGGPNYMGKPEHERSRRLLGRGPCD
jgi:hypothetical protein